MLKHCTGIFEIQFSFHKKSVLKKNDETICIYFLKFSEKIEFHQKCSSIAFFEVNFFFGPQFLYRLVFCLFVRDV